MEFYHVLLKPQSVHRHKMVSFLASNVKFSDTVKSLFHDWLRNKLSILMSSIMTLNVPQIYLIKKYCWSFEVNTLNQYI